MGHALDTLRSSDEAVGQVLKEEDGDENIREMLSNRNVTSWIGWSQVYERRRKKEKNWLERLNF